MFPFFATLAVISSYILTEQINYWHGLIIISPILFLGLNEHSIFLFGRTNEFISIICHIISGMFFYNYIRPTTIEFAFVVGIVATAYILEKPIKKLPKLISNRLKLYYFLFSSKYNTLHFDYWRSSLTFVKRRYSDYGTRSIVGYRSKDIIIFNKEYIKPKFKVKDIGVHYLEQDKFLKVIKSKPKNKDDLIVQMI